MKRSVPGVWLTVLMLVASGIVGCSSKADSTPNPEMKIPDIPKGDRSAPGATGKKP